MTLPNLSNHIRDVMNKEGWKLDSIRFHAEGEYNINYLISSHNDTYLFRINKRSQTNKKNQIAYEYTVLELLADSGYTPRPIRLFSPHDGIDAATRDSIHYAKQYFPRGFMIMEYIPGDIIAYEQSYLHVAASLACIHRFSQRYDSSIPLDKHPSPVAALIDESWRLLSRVPDSSFREAGDALREYINAIPQDEPEGDSCIVNTELNSGNIIASDNRTVIVDWEKAVYSLPYQDIAHFLLPTTTLWKSHFTFTREQEEEFCRVYSRYNPISCYQDILHTTMQFKSAVLARALSWCYTAWYEHHHNIRPVQDAHTLQTIQTYLQHIDDFLAS